MNRRAVISGCSDQHSSQREQDLIYTASFIAEIVRAGFLSVPKGQFEAATALGLRRSQTRRLVQVPQALRVIIPPPTSQYIGVVKNSSLAVAVAFPDLMQIFVGTVLNQTGAAVPIIGLTMAVYLAIALVASGIVNLYGMATVHGFGKGATS